MQTTKGSKDTKTEETATAIVDSAITVHRTLGPGLLESVYEKCLTAELVERGYACDVQRPVPVAYRNLRIDTGFRADLIVENCVLVELKAVQTLEPIHTAQILTYLKLTDIKLGFLINFNIPLLKNGLKRIVL